MIRVWEEPAEERSALCLDVGLHMAGSFHGEGAYEQLGPRSDPDYLRLS